MANNAQNWALTTGDWVFQLESSGRGKSSICSLILGIKEREKGWGTQTDIVLHQSWGTDSLFHTLPFFFQIEAQLELQ